MLHFDTNFLIALLRPDTPQKAITHRWRLAGQSFGISAVAWAEFLRGPIASLDVARALTLFDIVEPLLAADTEKAADLFNLIVDARTHSPIA